LTDGQVILADFAAAAAGGTLTGVLTDRAGAPIAGGRITLSPGDQATLTGADGTYRFAAVPPLVYMVTPSQTGTTFAPDRRRVRVPVGGSARADFTVAAAAVSGTVVAAGMVEPQPVASAHPVKAAGTQTWTVTRSGGHWIRLHFLRIDVQPGTERVEVVDGNGKVVSRWGGPFTDVWSGWASGNTVTVRYTSTGAYARYGFVVDVMQTDVNGRPLPNVAINLQPGSRSTQTDATGSFRFAGLGNNAFRVAASLQGWQFYPPVANVLVPSGTPEGTVTFLAMGPPSLSGQVTM